MVFAEDDLLLLPFGDKQHHEVVIVVLVDFRPLVLMLDVLDRQLMEFECFLEQVEIGVVRRFDVQPEPCVWGFVEASDDGIGSCRCLFAGCCDQGSQGNAKCAATARMTFRPETMSA